MSKFVVVNVTVMAEDDCESMAFSGVYLGKLYNTKEEALKALDEALDTQIEATHRYEVEEDLVDDEDEIIIEKTIMGCEGYVNNTTCDKNEIFKFIVQEVKE